MQTYLNLSGNSSVTDFEIGSDYIVVRFKKDKYGVAYEYLYNYTNPGVARVEDMKILAKAGKGLASFIVRSVRANYVEKRRVA